MKDIHLLGRFESQGSQALVAAVAQSPPATCTHSQLIECVSRNNDINSHAH